MKLSDRARAGTALCPCCRPLTTSVPSISWVGSTASEYQTVYVDLAERRAPSKSASTRSQHGDGSLRYVAHF